jgi:Fur family zinc uptake transcriptional regulator
MPRRTKIESPQDKAQPAAAGSAARGLSPNERAVLDQLRSQLGQPVSAYDLVAKLKDQGIRYPVTVYRALEKLMIAGLVHRIETANAFVACCDTCDAHQPLFAVCDDCGRATELHTDDAVSVLEAAVSKIGFEVSAMNLELKGTCSDCQRQSGSTAAKA